MPRVVIKQNTYTPGVKRKLTRDFLCCHDIGVFDPCRSSEMHYVKNGFVNVYYGWKNWKGLMPTVITFSLIEVLEQSWKNTDLLSKLRREMIEGINKNKIPKEDFCYVEMIEKKIWSVFEAEGDRDFELYCEEMRKKLIEEEKIEEYEKYCGQCKEIGEEIVSFKKYFEDQKKAYKKYFEKEN